MNEVVSVVQYRDRMYMFTSRGTVWEVRVSEFNGALTYSRCSDLPHEVLAAK